jgi:hypothetical protein
MVFRKVSIRKNCQKQKLERIRYDIDLDFISTYINRIGVYREKN